MAWPSTVAGSLTVKTKSSPVCRSKRLAVGWLWAMHAWEALRVISAGMGK